MLALIDQHIDFPFKLKRAILKILNILHSRSEQCIIRTAHTLQLLVVVVAHLYELLSGSAVDILIDVFLYLEAGVEGEIDVLAEFGVLLAEAGEYFDGFVVLA